MTHSIIVPKLGMTMSEATLVEWKAANGDFVEKNYVVLTIETEKISWNIEAGASGYLHIMVEKGIIARVGQIVGQILETREEYEALQKEENMREAVGMFKQEETQQTEIQIGQSKSEKMKYNSPASPAARSSAKKLGVDITKVSGSGPGGRITEIDIVNYSEITMQRSKITPLANKIVEDVGLDTRAIEGTGDRGKITKQDVLRAIEVQKQEISSAVTIKAIPLTGMRKAIAGAMLDSIHGTAQASIFTEVDVTEMLKFHHQIREEYEGQDVHITLTDIMIIATCRSLKRIPIMNSTLNGDEILLYDSINMGIAVSLPEGLIVPVLKNVDKKKLSEISREREALVKRARDGKLMVDEVVGGTFTISNVSLFNVCGATPILRKPENGILAFGGIKKKPAVYKDQIAIRSIMVVSLTFDHQVIDGAPAAQYMSTVCKYLENPYTMFD